MVVNISNSGGDFGTVNKFNNVNAIETRVFYYLCGFALLMNFTIAGANIFLALLTLGMLHRLWLKHDDVKEILGKYRFILIAVAVYWGALLLSLIGADTALKGFKRFFDFEIYRMMGFFAVLFCVHSKKRLYKVASFLLGGIFLNNIATIAMAIYQGEGVASRISGFMGYMEQGTFLAVACPVALVLIGELGGKKRALMAIFLVLALLAFLINGTRGAWLACLATVLLSLLFYIRGIAKKLGAIAVIFAVLTAIFALNPTLMNRLESVGDTTNMRSNTERLLIWESAYKMFLDHPLTGVGFGGFDKAYHEGGYMSPKAQEPWLNHAHSNIMQNLAEGGALGAITFGGMWLALVLFALKEFKRTHKRGYIIFFAVTMALMLHGLTEYNIGSSAEAKFLWLTLALALKDTELMGARYE